MGNKRLDEIFEKKELDYQENKDGFPLAAFVCGLLSLTIFLNFIVSPLAVFFYFLGKKYDKKNYGLIGLILGIVFFLVFILVLLKIIYSNNNLVTG